LIYPVDTTAGPDATNMPFDQADAFKIAVVLSWR